MPASVMTSWNSAAILLEPGRTSLPFASRSIRRGDMRRVVVAADAANRFFGLDGVHADEVGELFDLIGWRRANSFTQTIRNAARAKFGWMERIPGRSGRYAATDVGRSTTLTG